jgi:catalase-peroxidase
VCEGREIGIQQDFNGSRSDGKRVSFADVVVLAGSAGIEKAAKDAGHDVTVPFAPGAHRRLAGRDRCRVARLAPNERHGFRNYLKAR